MPRARSSWRGQGGGAQAEAAAAPGDRDAEGSVVVAVAGRSAPVGPALAEFVATSVVGDAEFPGDAAGVAVTEVPPGAAPPTAPVPPSMLVRSEEPDVAP